MPPQQKPYRRFIARGKSAVGLDGLQQLTQGTSAVERAPAGGDPVPDPWTPGPERRWWSFRTLGAWGWIWRVGIVAILGIVTWGVFGFISIRDAVSDAHRRVTATAQTALSPAGPLLSSPQNTLVIGVDARPGETRSRTDTIMVMRTDPGAGKVKWLSIPRDFRVDLPGNGTQKINAAHYFSGQKGVIDAVRNLTGLPIHHLIVIRFNGVTRMVDDVGGVTVNNPTALENCPYAGGIRVSFVQGPIDLDGETALQFVRVRKCDNDLHRAARQQAFVTGLKAKLASLTAIPFSPWRGAGVIRALGTDMGISDVMKLGWLQWRLRSDPNDRIVLAGMPRTVGGVSYVIGEPDLDEKQLTDFVRP
ncbi:MAG: LytR family transcriptional regulator [Thermoleophilia bacterium]|nr:LytR family transcriptional regulator [Thermoleophilia bacterium]